MGQVLRKTKLRPPPEHVAPTQALRPVDMKSTTPKSQVIIDPEQNTVEIDKRDHKFDVMSQRVVGSISTRPGGKQEMGSAILNGDFGRPMPSDRHTTLLSGPDEDRIMAPGTLNIAQLREVFLLYHGQCEGQVKALDLKTLAEKYNVDAVLLERVFRSVSLPLRQQS